jgi:hypothetical protein
MELDHDSGAMHGQIVAGRYQGAALDSLDVPTLVGLLGDIDDDSRQLLMAYLDRRQPRWRENARLIRSLAFSPERLPRRSAVLTGPS